MRTVRNIKKRIQKTQKRKKGGDLDCVYYSDLLREIHIFFDTPLVIKNYEKPIILNKIKNILSFITMSITETEISQFYKLKKISEIKNTSDNENFNLCEKKSQPIDEQKIYEGFIDCIKHIFKDNYNKMSLDQPKLYGYSPKEIEFATLFIQKLRYVYLTLENKSKSESISLASKYMRGLFNPEIKVFNDCCSLLAWDAQSVVGEKLLHDILSYMMGNTKFDFNTSIPILEKYVKLCYESYTQ